MNRISTAILLVLVGATISWAEAPEPPSRKPSRDGAAQSGFVTPSPSGPLSGLGSVDAAEPAPAPASGPDVAILEAALKAAERSDWPGLASLQARAQNPALRDLILWMRASEGVPGMGFEELTAAIITLKDWPRVDDMHTRAEEIITLSGLDDRARIAWLEQSGPRTGAGKVALARSLSNIGQSSRAETLVKDAWRNHPLEDGLDRTVQANFGSWLTREDHIARTDYLLWTGRLTAAKEMKPFLDTDRRKLVDARAALASNARTVDALVNAVPASLSEDPGLLFERARYRRKRDNQEGATALLDGIDGNRVPVAARSRLWDERSLAMREDLKTSNWARAYRLAAPHGMSRGEDFADAEFASGWIALRLKQDAPRALKHFQALDAGVGAPVSKARAAYWSGRAHEALGDREASAAAYRSGAAHRFTYYGQLAAERAGERRLNFAATRVASQADELAFEARPMVRALRLLGDAGETTKFRTIAFHLDDLLTNETEYLLLSKVARDYDLPDVGVRTAKGGLQKGIVSPEAAYPIVNYPLLVQANVERSLTLALTRQETEMNPNARSSVGARGLMQLMPLTAKGEAKRLGLAYSVSKLNDPSYNMTLGSHYVDSLLDDFNGSYIMAAAAYNAGPSRPRRWAQDYGDPRTGAIDPVDWVEFIPFSETRNYVQRVMENTQVYRHRLSGQPEEIRLSEDLRRGRR